MHDADVDRIVDDILKSRRISEGAAFSSRVYSDRPILTTGKRLREQQSAPGEPSTSLHGSRQDGGAAADAVVRVPRAVPAWKGSSHGRLAPDLGSPGATPARPEMPERYRQMVFTHVTEQFTDNYLHAIQHVTPATLQRLAQKYLTTLTTVTAGPCND